MQGITSGLDFPKPGVCWLAAPDERTPGFLPVFACVSIAVQTLLRQRVPASYWTSLESFIDLKTAYPMLVYQASQPFRGKMRPELTYDVLNPQTLAKLFRTAKANLGGLLAEVEARLRAAGLDGLARKYEQRQAPNILQAAEKWNKSRKCLYLLIRGEGVLVNALVDLGGLGNLPPAQQSRRLASFEKKWRFQLRRLCPGMDFTWLAPELLETAGQALASALVRPTTTCEPGTQDGDLLPPESEDEPTG